MHILINQQTVKETTLQKYQMRKRQQREMFTSYVQTVLSCKYHTEMILKNRNINAMCDVLFFLMMSKSRLPTSAS